VLYSEFLLFTASFEVLKVCVIHILSVMWNGVIFRGNYPTVIMYLTCSVSCGVNLHLDLWNVNKLSSVQGSFYRWRESEPLRSLVYELRRALFEWFWIVMLYLLVRVLLCPVLHGTAEFLQWVSWWPHRFCRDTHVPFLLIYKKSGIVFGGELQSSSFL
jgi:hypothetical protein